MINSNVHNSIFEASQPMEATMEYVFNSYGMMPNSKLTKLSSFIKDNNLHYIGRIDMTDVFVNESTVVGLPLNKKTLMNGDISFTKISEEVACEQFDITPAVEDITKTVDLVLHGMAIAMEDIDLTGATVVGDEGGGNAMQDGGNDSGGGGNVEDITQTTAQSLGGNEDPAATANDMNGDDFGDVPGEGPGEGEDNQGDSGNPEMLDDDNSDQPDDEGTAAKKRIRKNMYKLHTIIKDALDAMATFTPSYDIKNSKKYYRIQNILNTEDEILIRIITKQINDLTVEDLMKKYTTLCNIFDIATREMHEFKEEYKKLAESRGTKRKRNADDR